MEPQVSQQGKPSVGSVETFWGLPRRAFIPLILTLIGGMLADVSPEVGGGLAFIGFAWLAFTSLPVGLAVYVAAAPFPIGLVYHHHHFFVSDVMAILLAIALLWKYRDLSVSGWFRQFFPSAFRWPVALMLFFAFLSFAHPMTHSGVAIKILELIEFFVVIVAVAADSPPDMKTWGPVLFAVFFIAVVVAVQGLEQFMLGDGPASFAVYTDHMRAYGPFGQPNVFGAFMDQLFPLGISLYVFGPKGRYKGWLLAALVLIGLSVWTSFSRGSWVADIAAMGLMGLIAGKSRGWNWDVIQRYAQYGVLLPVVLFGVMDGLGHIHIANTAFALKIKHFTATNRVTSITAGSKDFATNQRFIIWHAALTAIRQHLFTGVGMGEFHLWIAQHMPKGLIGVPPHAHDIYLEWGADMGIGGIIAILWLEWRWMATSIRSIFGRFGQLDDFTYAMSLGAMGTFTAFIVHNWVDYMVDHGVIVPLLLAMGFIAAMVRRHRQTAQ